MRLALIEPKTSRRSKALDDVGGRLDLVERHRLALLASARLDLEQAADGQQRARSAR
jgi:hypothetical protein